MVIRQQLDCGRDRIAGALKNVEDHGVVDLEAGGECLWFRVDEVVERFLGPEDHTLGRLHALDALELLGVVSGFGDAAGIFDLMLGGLDDHISSGVESGAAGAARDLVELAGREMAGLGAVELGEGGQEDRADRDVDAHA